MSSRNHISLPKFCSLEKMENSECKKSWEEEMYWKHFNSLHFCMTLPPYFHDHLVLPEKFASHMRAQLPNKVSLKGPSGVLWQIELQKSDDLLFVGNEWKDFVKANELKENCLLMFKYERNLSFEVLIFDHESFCEKEAAYFIKCRHNISEHEDKKTRTEREAASTEIIEDDFEEDSTIVSKKPKKGNGLVACSREKVNTQTPRNRVPYTAARVRGRPRRVQLPCKSPTKPNVLSRKKSIGKKRVKKFSAISPRDMITPENGESSPKNDHSRKLENQSKKRLKCVSKELSQISRRKLITPENGNNSPLADHSLTLKCQSENQPSGEPGQISEWNLLTIEHGESFWDIDRPLKLKAQSEKKRSRNDSSKELITPENIEYSPVTDCSPRVEGQAEKEPSGTCTAKELTQILGQQIVSPDYIERFPEENYSHKSSCGKRGRPKKLVLPTSSKKCLSRSASNAKSFPNVYMSNRRAVTEEEKEDALRRAIQEQTDNSFTVIMPPSSVYRRFFLSVPMWWLSKHYLPRQRVVLRVGEKTWVTSFLSYGKRGGFSCGWKAFALENFLEEFDVCVFELVSQTDEAAVMDVAIFRVVPTITPPLPIVF